MNPSQSENIKLLVFDVFGTVVDWRSSVIAEGEQLGKAKGLNIDWAAFADAWRSIYRPYMDKVQNGELPWTKLDDLHRIMLAETLKKFAIENLSDDEKEHLNRVWHRLNTLAGFCHRTATNQVTLRDHALVQWQHFSADEHGQTRRLALGLHLVRGKCPPLQTRSIGLFTRAATVRFETRAGHDGRRSRT